MDSTKLGTSDEMDRLQSLDYLGQWDAALRYWLRMGSWPLLPWIVVHHVWALVQVAVVLIVTHCNTGALSWDSVAFHDVLMKNAIIIGWLMAFLALDGFMQGALNGEPHFRQTTCTFVPGTLKVPLFPTFFAYKRTLLDMLNSIITVVNATWMLCTPIPAPTAVAIHLFTVLFLGLMDFSRYEGPAKGLLHGPLAIVLFVKFALCGDGALAWLQSWLILLYVSCGLGKFGIWFVTYFSFSLIQSPWTIGSTILKKLLFVDMTFGADNTPTHLAVGLGYVVALIEIGSPLLLFLTPGMLASLGLESFGGIPVGIGIGLLIWTHVFVVALSLPTDVDMLNVLPCYLMYYSFRVANFGFDYEDARLMPWIPGIMLFCLVGRTTYGHVFPDRVAHMTGYRLAAGNWGKLNGSFFLLSEAGWQKVAARFPQLGFPSGPYHLARDLHLVSEAAVAPMWFTQLAAFFSQMLASRIMPALIRKALNGERLTEGFMVVHGPVMQFWAFGGFVDSAVPLLQIIQSECALESGDVKYVQVGAFASVGGQRCAWSIHDAKDGQLASGVISKKACLAITRPDLAQIAAPSDGLVAPLV